MNEIIIANNSLPQLCGCGLFAASESFIHTDRVPDFCVLIYVIDGCIYVTEGDTDYEVNAGELLILKNGIHHFGKKKIQKGTKWIFLHFRISADCNASPFIRTLLRSVLMTLQPKAFLPCRNFLTVFLPALKRN